MGGERVMIMVVVVVVPSEEDAGRRHDSASLNATVTSHMFQRNACSLDAC